MTLAKTFEYNGETLAMERSRISGAILTSVHINLGNQPTFIKTLTTFGTFTDARKFVIECLDAATRIRKLRREGRAEEANYLERKMFP